MDIKNFALENMTPDNDYDHFIVDDYGIQAEETIDGRLCDHNEEPWLVAFIDGRSDLCIVNGDDAENSPYYSRFDLPTEFESMPTVSFTCIARLLDIDVMNVGFMINSREIEILDYTGDQSIKIPYKERRKFENKDLSEINKFAPKGYSYNYIEQCWHMSSTVLFKHEGVYYIIGQDEGSYFGCELSGKPKTIEAAFEDLKPKQVCGVEGVLRQGEWFLIPVKETEVPDFSFNVIRGYASIVLPMESKESNEHNLCGDICIDFKTGRIFAQEIELWHEEHDGINTRLTNGWYEIVRNTAVRSVSVQGVD